MNTMLDTSIPFGLSVGGTGAALTPSAGGLFYSTSSQAAILAGTPTANQILLSGASSAPSWSTTVYPSTNPINTIMYASSANVLGVITPVNNAVLVSSAGGVPSMSTTLPGGLTIPGYQTTITPAALTSSNDTNVTISLGGSPSNALLAATSLTMGWTGQLSETRGGTNQSGYTLGDILYASATNTLSRLAGNTSNVIQFLSQKGDGTLSAAPSWQTFPTAGVAAYFFYNLASDIGGYLQETPTPSTNSLQTLTTSGVTGTQLLYSFATNSGVPGITIIPFGIINLLIHASQTAGSKTVTLYAEIYTRTSGGVETLIATTSNTAVLTGSNVEYQVDCTLASAITLSSTDRLVTKIYAVASATGSAATVNLYVEGTTSSRVELPSVSVNAGNFVPYSGATSNLNLGTFSIIGGIWAASVITGTYGGTGVNNGASTITIGGNVTFSGAFTFTGTVTGNTAVTFPTSGTLATTSQLPTPSALTSSNDTNVTITLGGSPSTALLAATSLTMGWTGQLAVTRGGTGSSTVVTSPTASSWAAWDSNKNFSANSFLNGYTTTATAGSTTTLTAASTELQYFTGTSSQTVVLPVTSTLALGQRYQIVNSSTGTITVNSSGGNAVVTLPANTSTWLTCILTTGTTAASWLYASGLYLNNLTCNSLYGQKFYSSTNPGVQVLELDSASSSDTDYFQITTGTTNNAVIQLVSSSTNASFSFLAKGSGGIVIGSTSATCVNPMAIAAGGHNVSFYVPTITANRTLTYPDGDVTLVAGTMLTTTSSQKYAITTFTASGTFTTPSDSNTGTIYKYIIVGGGGGGGGTNGTWAVGGGGGSGAYCEGTFTGVAANTAITVTVGTTASGGSAAGGTGGTGNASSIGTPVSITAGGGGGGLGGTNPSGGITKAGGAGGTVTGSPTISLPGNVGFTGATNGSNQILGGKGGEGPWGGGGQGGMSQFGAGQPGSSPGAGGGGAVAATAGGGSGAAGIVIIERITP